MMGGCHIPFVSDELSAISKHISVSDELSART
jgi:hypothetical protein